LGASVPAQTNNIKIDPDSAHVSMHYSLLADIVVVIHLAYACFVLFGFLAIVIGVYCNWVWIRNYPFRVLHLACTAFVFLETALGITCPLTIVENFFSEVDE